MEQGANIIYNLFTIVFIVLAVGIGVVVISVATDSMEPPILAPEATDPPPTIFSLPTMTPTGQPDVDGTITPTPDGQ